MRARHQNDKRQPADQIGGEEVVRMNKYLGYCGLDCEKCEARLATINNDDALRDKVAKEWSEMNGMEILPSMINCVGCKIDGQRTYFCDVLCPIRKCAVGKSVDNCGICESFLRCTTVEMITKHSQEALANLTKESSQKGE